MLNKETANELFLTLKKQEDLFNKEPTTKNHRLLQIHENKCIKEFDYMVKFGASKYKTFNNYQDLLQEGYIALMSALKTYKEERGDIFWWCHKYIDTKIYRKANKHFVVDIPLIKAKKMDIKSVDLFSIKSEIIEESSIDSVLEIKEQICVLQKAINSLDKNQKEVIINYLENDLNKKKMSVSKKYLNKSIMKIKRFIKDSC